MVEILSICGHCHETSRAQRAGLGELELGNWIAFVDGRSCSNVVLECDASCQMLMTRDQDGQLLCIFLRSDVVQVWTVGRALSMRAGSDRPHWSLRFEFAKIETLSWQK
jgi:hypothetical protein